MKYRNIRNGAVIDIPSVLNDKNWETVEDQQDHVSSVSESAPKKKVVKANGRKQHDSKLCDSK